MHVAATRGFTTKLAGRAGAAALTAAVVLVGVLVTAGSAFALSERDAGSDGFHDGPFEVSFTSDNAEPMRRPYFDVAGAMPGMTPKHTSVRIANTGTHAAGYSVSVTDLQSQGSHSLDDVLEATVRHESTGSVAYRGRLSGLHVDGLPLLQPGAVAVYIVEVAWPDTPADDNPYQNAALTFALKVVAIQS